MIGVKTDGAQRVVTQFELTPKAFANLSPRLERSDNPGLE
jgi:hypothetical protein